MRRLLLVAVIVLGACSPEDAPTAPTTAPEAGLEPSMVIVGPGQYVVDFNAYAEDDSLAGLDWTPVVRTPDSIPRIGNWRAQTVEGSLRGKAAVLLDPPTLNDDKRALGWDGAPVLDPPLEILAHLWLAPAENRSTIGIAWYIQPTAGPTPLNTYALTRDCGGQNNRFCVERLHDDNATSFWFGPLDSLVAEEWAWIRVQHLMDPSEGTVRFRAWQGDLEDEPETWDFEDTNSIFGEAVSPDPALPPDRAFGRTVGSPGVRAGAPVVGLGSGDTQFYAPR